MTKYFTKDGDNYVEVSETLHTQDHLDQVVKERADRIARKEFGDYDELKEKAAKYDKDVKDFEGKLKAAGDEKTNLEKQLGAAKLETEKVKIINEFKLSDELAEFVDGDDVDQLRQRAEKLAKGVTGGSVKIKKQGKPDEKTTDSKVLAGKLFGNKSDD